MDDGWLKSPENIRGWSRILGIDINSICCKDWQRLNRSSMIWIIWCLGLPWHFLPTAAHASPRIRMSNKNFERTFESQQGRAFGLQTSRIQFLQLRVLRSLPPTLPKLRAQTRSNDIGQLRQRFSTPRRKHSCHLKYYQVSKSKYIQKHMVLFF